MRYVREQRTTPLRSLPNIEATWKDRMDLLRGITHTTLDAERSLVFRLLCLRQASVGSF